MAIKVYNEAIQYYNAIVLGGISPPLTGALLPTVCVETAAM